MTSLNNSGLKKPIPQRPITPEMQSNMPMMARPRQRESPSRDVYDPNLTPVTLPAARAFTHFSGSLSFACMKIHNTTGNAPMKNIHSQALPGLILKVSSQPTNTAIEPAVTFPTADSACRRPRACGRARSGNVSATRATASTNTPPTQSPKKKRSRANIGPLVKNPQKPVKMENKNTVRESVFARPMRSPRSEEHTSELQ